MRPSRNSRRLPATTPPRGAALLVVLVVITLLALSAYTFTQTMQTDYEAAVIHSQEVQVRQAADSGVEYVAALLARRSPTGEENLHHNPAWFQAIPVVETERTAFRARFSVIASLEADPSSTRVRYGLVDESAKLNLNLLDELPKELQLSDEDIESWLLYVPGMTTELIAAIRDWIDADSDIRPGGAESETYEALQPPYAAKNGPLESLDELLLVRGVTPQLLYGEDANRNGLLDPNENDGDASPPFDNADGILNPGWSGYLTVLSRERNLRADGQPRINLNNGLLTELYDQLKEEFDEDTAKFVIAYRINGPKPQASSSTSSNGQVASNSRSSASASTSRGSGSNTASGRSSSGGGAQGPASSRSPSAAQGSPPAPAVSGGSSSNAAVDRQTQQMLTTFAQQMAQAMFQRQGQVTRGGIDLSRGGSVRIKSVFDLIGAQVQAQVNGASQTLNSPWPADPGQLHSILPALMDVLSVSDDQYRIGRININQARAELLYGIPNMTPELVSSIMAAQARQAEGIPSSDTLRRHSTPGWLYLDGLVDLETMRALDPFLTARGDVFRAQVLGFYDSSGPVHRQEAIIDATRTPPRVVWQRDLNELGRGYSRSQLIPLPAR
jgi:hypothetical protein